MAEPSTMEMIFSHEQAAPGCPMAGKGTRVTAPLDKHGFYNPPSIVCSHCWWQLRIVDGPMFDTRLTAEKIIALDLGELS